MADPWKELARAERKLEEKAAKGLLKLEKRRLRVARERERLEKRQRRRGKETARRVSREDERQTRRRNQRRPREGPIIRYSRPPNRASGISPAPAAGIVEGVIERAAAIAASRASRI